MGFEGNSYEMSEENERLSTCEKEVDEVKERSWSADKTGKWSNDLDFVMSCLGFAVGIGNIWRFPYLCYKNGGGAFLIPYLICLITCGIPLLVLEVGLGQYMSLSTIGVWRICPGFAGIGVAAFVITFLMNIYYIIVLTWAIYYLYSSFSMVLPWSHCGNVWNTKRCYVQGDVEINTTDTPLASENNTIDVSRGSHGGGGKTLDAVVEFWERQVLQISDGIYNPGSVVPGLAVSLLIAWTLIYFCVWRGVKWTGKVVYFTALFPYVVLTCLLIRGVTLDGARDGLWFFIRPDLSRLADPQFVAVEVTVTAVFDMFPRRLTGVKKRMIVTVLYCFVSFLLGISMITQGGIYVFQLFDYYSASGLVLLWAAFFETVVIAWVFGTERFQEAIQLMIGHRIPYWFVICWKYITPLISMSIFISMLAVFKPLTYNKTYIYPRTAQGLGMCLAIASIICIPLVFIVRMINAPGNLKMKWKHVTKPQLKNHQLTNLGSDI